MKTPTRAIKWQNGMLMVFDENGKQIPKYQGIAIECLPKLLKDYPNVAVESLDWNRGRR